jgi:protein subunit release factor A
MAFLQQSFTKLDLIMDGAIDPLIDALITHYQAEKLNAEMVAA